MPSLADLQQLRTVLGRLDAERPAVQLRGLGRTLYERRPDDFLGRLELDLQSRRGKARVLVTGQIGVGKSSELRQFFRHNRSEVDDRRLGYPVYCDLEKQESPERCGATGVLLTILRDCWGGLSQLRRSRSSSFATNLYAARDEMLSRLVDYLNGTRVDGKEEVTLHFGGMELRVSLAENIRNASLNLILARAAHYEAVADPAKKLSIDPDSLIVLLNQLLQVLEERSSGRRPMLFVDHVDKIRDPKAAEDVLVRAFAHWERIEASIIMTAPYEFTLGELRSSVESRWDVPRVLYPVDIPDADTGEVPEFYQNIAKSAGLSVLLPEDSLRLAAHYSGGILRTYVQLLVGAAKEAHFARHDVIEPTDVLAVVHLMERAYQDYDVRDLALLDEVVRSGTGLRNAVTLLRSPIGLLVREGAKGQQGLQVHPLARSTLERYHRRSKVTV